MDTELGIFDPPVLFVRQATLQFVVGDRKGNAHPVQIEVTFEEFTEQAFVRACQDVTVALAEVVKKARAAE